MSDSGLNKKPETEQRLGRAGRIRLKVSRRRLCQAAAFATFCYLIFYVAWPYSDQFSTKLLSDKERVPAEIFLYFDPLTSLSTALAGRFLSAALVWLMAILILCLFAPRFFCSYVCPLGATIDLFDSSVGVWARRFHSRARGGWVKTKYYILAAVLFASLFGVLLSGYVAAIPTFTRGVVFIFGAAQLALLKSPGMVRPVSWEYWLGAALFLGVIGLSLLGRRFWCRNVCPSGAVFSLFSMARLFERRVTEACVRCGRCREACPFGAIKADFTSSPMDCAFCFTCAGKCREGAIQFVKRERRVVGADVRDERLVSRRGFIGASAVGTAAALVVSADLFGGQAKKKRFLRPPGSVKEELFLDLCIRCGECLKVCPGPVLHPAGVEGGVEALWTPVVVPSWAGCHQDCNFCGQVCPTGAIRPLSIAQKRKTRMGLAVINTKTCLPHRGERDCQLCYDECQAAGYNAIAMKEIRLDAGDAPPGVLSVFEIEEASRIMAPFISPDACVGCGLCEYRCHNVWTKQQRLLQESAVKVLPQNEDRG